MPNERFDAVILGSGFGGTVAAAACAKAGLKTLILERGTWWVTPEPTPVPTGGTPIPVWAGQNGHPVQYWPRPNSSRGLIYFWHCIHKSRPNDMAPPGLGSQFNGLYRYTRFQHQTGNVDVISSSGVGGGSLIYSGVNLKPESHVLQRIGLPLTEDDFRAAGAWMGAKRGRMSKVVTHGPVPHRQSTSGTAYQLPRPVNPPEHEAGDPSLPAYEDYELLDRSRALLKARAAAVANQAFGADVTVDNWRPLPLSITEYEPDQSVAGTPTGNSDRDNTHCRRQGRCMLGCLPAARHTLNKTLYRLINPPNPDPGPPPVLYPKTEVLFVEKHATRGYTIHYRDHWVAGGQERQVDADKVFFAAGTLGTNEILLRSHANAGASRIELGPTRGQHFSTNGDFFGFALGTTERVNPAIGPINASGFHLAYSPGSNQQIDVCVEDCGIPPMWSAFLQGASEHFSNSLSLKLYAAAKGVLLTLGQDPFPLPGVPNPMLNPATTPDNYATEQAMTAHTFVFHGMAAAADEPRGTFSLAGDGSLQLVFDRSLKQNTMFRRVEDTFSALAAQMGGTYISSPMWVHQDRAIVVHPLGGCPIGSDRTNGVVDEFGRVYDGSGASPTAVHDGLYVVDGAAIPGALGVNPTFTIVAQAIKSVSQALA